MNPRDSRAVTKKRSKDKYGHSIHCTIGENGEERPPDMLDSLLGIGGSIRQLMEEEEQEEEEESGSSTTATSRRRSHMIDRAMEGEEIFDTVEEKQTNCVNKIVVAIILAAFIAFVIADSLTNKWIATGLTTFLEWMRANPDFGVLVFILVYFVATVLFVPGTILTLGAGFVFGDAFGLLGGVLLGSFSVFIGASAGAIVSFLVGRFLLRDWVTKWTRRYAIFEALDTAFEEKGFRIMALLRLSPIIPFNAINYIAGVTAINFWSYVWALIAILPGTTLYVFLGASAGSLTESATSGGDNFVLTIIIACVGIVFGILAITVAGYYAKKELRNIAEKREQEGGGRTGSSNVDGSSALASSRVGDDGNDEEMGSLTLSSNV